MKIISNNRVKSTRVFLFENNIFINIKRIKKIHKNYKSVFHYTRTLHSLTVHQSESETKRVILVSNNVYLVSYVRNTMRSEFLLNIIHLIHCKNYTSDAMLIHRTTIDWNLIRPCTKQNILFYHVTVSRINLRKFHRLRYNYINTNCKLGLYRKPLFPRRIQVIQVARAKQFARIKITRVPGSN